MNDVPASAPLNATWFCIHYSDAAPAGLPPVIQAARTLRYSDDTGTWFVALWDPTNRNDDPTSACILRVPAEYVASVTRHPDMGSAAQQIHFGETT